MTTEMDITAAKKTYAGFITLFKTGTIVSIILAAIVVLLISN